MRASSSPNRRADALAAAAFVATVLAWGSSALSACDGGPLSLGSELTLVSTSSVRAALEACASGFEHPNVCCDATAAGRGCGTYPLSPFGPCPTGYATYPDPRTCCSLDAPRTCEAPDGVVEPTSECLNACEPGFFALDAGACCTADHSAISCTALPPVVCNGPACDGDAAACASTCSAVTCATCPTGFTAPSSDLTLCCRTTAAFGAECFSQATGSLEGTDDAGAISPGDASAPDSAVVPTP